MTTEPMYLYCPQCRRDELAEVPPCLDGHDVAAGECPDRACVACGTALLLDAQLVTLALPEAALPTLHSRHAA